MTTQPNTPASRNEVFKTLIEALDRYMRQDETAGDTDNGVYRNAKVVMSDALASRTEQAVPSAASGVEPAGALASSEHYDEVKATLQGAHSIMETVSRLERRVGPIGSHARGYTHKITNALRHLEALAAPGAAIAARGQELPKQSFLQRWTAVINETNPREVPTAEPFQKALDIRIAQGWQLGGNACPVLYTDTINGEQVCRDDLWLATTAGLKGASPATVAQPVEWQYRSRPNWRNATGWSDWQKCSAEVAQDYIRTPSLHDWHYQVRALYEAAQPCASQGCGGDGGDVMYALKWCAAALQALVDSRGESGSISMVVSGEKKSLEDVLDLADAALSTDKGDGGSTQ